MYEDNNCAGVIKENISILRKYAMKYLGLKGH